MPVHIGHIPLGYGFFLAIVAILRKDSMVNCFHHDSLCFSLQKFIACEPWDSPMAVGHFLCPCNTEEQFCKALSSQEPEEFVRSHVTMLISTQVNFNYLKSHIAILLRSIDKPFPKSPSSSFGMKNYTHSLSSLVFKSMQTRKSSESNSLLFVQDCSLFGLLTASYVDLGFVSFVQVLSTSWYFQR